jgi:tetratricopeptide (TPR) repeat protein
VDFNLNANAWDLFEHSNDKEELLKALEWSDRAIKLAENPNGSYIDTYANILYKLGRIEESLAWQKKAFKLDSNNVAIKSNLDKMRCKKPTWPSK